ncbi:hypothetical protein HQ586_02460 [Candidatus Bathyarchaeota archaeon]|nr:hypothetical protein [Candidatus Bathyarchaeota archaeon]
MNKDNDLSTIKLEVAEAKIKYVGRSIAIVDSETMKTLGIKNGEVIEIIGKKITTAKVLSIYPEDKGLGLIRMDGFIRKNCGVPLKDFVTVKKAKTEDASSIKLSPIDIRISVDSDFIRYVRDRLMGRPCIKGDVLRVTMLGHTVPFLLHETEPEGIVTITSKTTVIILSEPTPPEEEVESLRRRFRFKYLQNVEAMYAVDETFFYIKSLEDGESKQHSMDEREIIEIASRLAINGGETIEIRVEFLERRGSIEPEGFSWAKVDQLGNIRYTYPDEWCKLNHS